MKNKVGIVIIIAGMVFGAMQAQAQKTTPLEDAKLVGDERIATPYGTVELVQNYMTDESSKLLFDAMDMQRAAQAYIWSTPIVSFYTWIEEQNRVYETGNLGVSSPSFGL